MSLLLASGEFASEFY